MYRSDLGLIRSSIVSKGWKEASIKCYLANCICSKCKLAEETNLVYPHCQIKAYVIELVKRFGVPDLEGLEDDRLET